MQQSHALSFEKHYQNLECHGNNDLIHFTAKHATAFLSPGDTLIVEKCGDCPHCKPETWMLLRIDGFYMLKQKRDLEPYITRGLYLVGAKPTSVLIGRLVSWRASVLFVAAMAVVV